MDVNGKSIALAGKFASLSRETATAGLEALGAAVTASVTKKTDLVFGGVASRD